jgi:hypothetical protein
MPPVIAAVGGIAAAISAATGGAISAGEALPECTEFAPSGWPVIEQAETENAVED